MTPTRRVPRTPEAGDHPADAERLSQKPRPSGGIGRFLLLALAILLVMALLAAYAIYRIHGRGNEREQTSQAVQSGARRVQVVKPTRSPASFEFSLPGSAEALTTATLYARVNGYLKSRTADIGDRVVEGQLLAEIDAPDIDAQLSQARAQLEQTKAAEEIAHVTLDRQKKLVDEKVVSRQEYDQNRAAYDQAAANTKAAQAAVRNLEVQRGFTQIRAPFTGVVTTRYLNDGALISSTGSAAPSIFTVAQIDTLRVFIFVPQAYAPNVRPDQEVSITLPEFPTRVFKGKVTRTADSLDVAARTERVEIQLPSEHGALLPGMYLNVKFRVEQAAPPLIVPSNTVDIRKEGPRVAAVSKEGKVEYRPIHLGRDFGMTIEAIDGVTEADQLVVNPTPELVNGAKVEIAKDEKKPAAAGKPQG